MPLGLHFGPFLEPPGVSLGRSWASLGRLLGALGALLGSLGVLLGPSYAHLGRSWGGLWRILWLLSASGPLLRRSGGSQEPPETYFGTILWTIWGGIWEQFERYLVMLFLS